MTIHDAVAQLNMVCHNEMQTKEIVQMLSRVDMQVKREIFDTHANPPQFSGYTDGVSPDTQLLIPAPYDECYIRYLEAQIYYRAGEMKRYANAMMLFNTAYAAYSDFYNRNNMPVNAGDFCF